MKRVEVVMAETKNYAWECSGCWRVIPFRQPVLPDDDPAAEQNEDKDCPECGKPMYFDEVNDG